jgi:phosphotriesterase-related protein
MAQIATVRGPVDSSQLGVTLVHEHLCFGGPFSGSDEHAALAMDYQVKLARDAVAVGINTMVDAGPYPLVDRIIELNERVPDLNLILSTGAYLERVSPERIRALDEEAMVDHMVKDITEGYDGFEDTGVRAGIIKVSGSHKGLTEWEGKNFRAAARVQQMCKVPILTHACGLCREQMELLRDHGADINATFYSHVEAEFGWEGRSLDEEARYLADVTEAGGYLQFNNFDFGFDTPFADMLYLINYLEEQGYGDRIFISIDANWSVDDDGTVWHEAERRHHQTGKRTYAYVITNAAPMLMAAGVSLQRITRYLIDNPRRYFEALDRARSTPD